MAPGQTYGGYPPQGSYPPQQGYAQQPGYPDQSAQAQYPGYAQPQTYSPAPVKPKRKSGLLRKIGAILTMVGIVVVGIGITIDGDAVLSENSFSNSCRFTGTQCTQQQIAQAQNSFDNATSVVELLIGIGVIVLGVGIGLLVLTRPFSRMDA